MAISKFYHIIPMSDLPTWGCMPSRKYPRVSPVYLQYISGISPVYPILHNWIIQYPLVNYNIAIENGPVEIESFPIQHGGSFHSFWYVYQRVIWLLTTK